ncbi:Uncharacterised protein [Neisseria lactamica]|uniref:hypothetical protein n=1 Tax=Neisseria lactamica TaxID=486 RepID=UPI00019728B7|nr:hypothetical protein [Neisseria lactamica]KFJ36285.1 hypothetical protein DR91_20 [Neisseria lactamica ATCC 23970]VTQ47913.1 Uncharacterised protein [Neisseria lactamica]
MPSEHLSDGILPDTVLKTGGKGIPQSRIMCRTISDIYSHTFRHPVCGNIQADRQSVWTEQEIR